MRTFKFSIIAFFVINVFFWCLGLMDISFEVNKMTFFLNVLTVLFFHLGIGFVLLSIFDIVDNEPSDGMDLFLLFSMIFFNFVNYKFIQYYNGYQSFPLFVFLLLTHPVLAFFKIKSHRLSEDHMKKFFSRFH